MLLSVRWRLLRTAHCQRRKKMQQMTTWIILMESCKNLFIFPNWANARLFCRWSIFGFPTLAMHSPRDRNALPKQALFSSPTQKHMVEAAFPRETDVLDKLEGEVKVQNGKKKILVLFLFFFFFLMQLSRFSESSISRKQMSRGR